MKQVLAALAADGILLESDAAFPSLVATMVGGPVKGSWWGHPRGKEIFHTLNAVEDHPDVVTCRLVAGKVTFVHRPLWPSLLAVARGGEAWQTAGLDADAKKLLARVRKEGKVEAAGAAAKELELRLLCHGEQVHTESGKHVKVLETWEAWAERAECALDEVDAASGKKEIERVVDGINARCAAKATLPWRKTR